MFGFCWEALWVFIMIVRSMIFKHGRRERAEQRLAGWLHNQNVIAKLQKYNAW